VLSIKFFNFVNKNIIWIKLFPRLFFKKIFPFVIVFVDLFGLEHTCTLKFYNKINEKLIFMLGNAEVFSRFPKLFCYPICNYCYIFCIL